MGVRPVSVIVSDISPTQSNVWASTGLSLISPPAHLGIAELQLDDCHTRLSFETQGWLIIVRNLDEVDVKCYGSMYFFVAEAFDLSTGSERPVMRGMVRSHWLLCLSL